MLTTKQGDNSAVQSLQKGLHGDLRNNYRRTKMEHRQKAQKAQCVHTYYDVVETHCCVEPIGFALNKDLVSN